MGPASHLLEVDPPPILRVFYLDQGTGTGPLDPRGTLHIVMYLSSGGTSD